MTRSPSLALLLVGGMLLGACGSNAASPTPTQSSVSASPSALPTATPSPERTPRRTRRPSASATVRPGAVVVTFAVVDETYRVLLTDPDDIEIARRLRNGRQAPTIPNGRIIRGETGVNKGWSWSIDPQSIEFADITMEVCDGLPSHVEDGTLAGDRFCPWSAEVIGLAEE